MDFHVALLTDPVQPADALFQQVGIERQVEQDQVMGKLEVAALAADLRAHQGLGAIDFVGKVGGGPIPLDDGQALVKRGGAYARAQVQVMLQGDGGFGPGADHQCLGGAQFLEPPLQPLHPAVK